MAAADIMNCCLVTLDHTRSLLHGPKSVLKFRVNCVTTVRNIAIGLQIWLKTPIPAPKVYVLGDFDPQTLFFVIVKIRPPVFAVGDDKKKGKGWEGKERYAKSQVGYISAIWGADPVGPISTKFGVVVGIHDVIIHSSFGFNIFRGFRSTGGRNFRYPIDVAGHRYNSADATAQPVITQSLTSFLLVELVT